MFECGIDDLEIDAFVTQRELQMTEWRVVKGHAVRKQNLTLVVDTPIHR